jgi:hypothetical protein
MRTFFSQNDYFTVVPRRLSRLRSQPTINSTAHMPRHYIDHFRQRHFLLYEGQFTIPINFNTTPRAFLKAAFVIAQLLQPHWRIHY